jgi:hypothetical protein
MPRINKISSRAPCEDESIAVGARLGRNLGKETMPSARSNGHISAALVRNLAHGIDAMTNARAFCGTIPTRSQLRFRIAVIAS